jgi:hypothetical protein
MNEIEKLNNVILNENAYFFKNVDSIRISDNKIRKVFEDASTKKSGNYLLKIVNRNFHLDELDINYSFCAFKYDTKPTFIEEYIDKWVETKIAYFLIAEIGNYIVISKKNISNIQEFLNQFELIDYKVLSTLFVNNDTSFEKFGLKNMNVSAKAVRQKVLEANDLKENFSSLGASNYILNSLRVNCDNEKISILLNSSRINKFGMKNCIEDFLLWSKKLIDKIENHVEHETFLTIFAEPQDYELNKDRLTPIAILFLFSNLYEDFENNILDRVVYRFIEIDKPVKIFEKLDRFESLCQIDQIENSGESYYEVKNSIVKDLILKFNNKSITLKSNKLRNLILIYSNGTEIPIIDYINQSNQFLINFDNLDMIYTNRKLFKDTKLLGNINHFLKIFKPYPELINVLSEKGSLNITSTTFDSDSIFGFVENEFKNECKYLICDDLNKEWADHIGISDDKIMFIHSKHKDAKYSASAFQDIVGQAQKNLGNMSPQDFQLESKLTFWEKKYSNDNVDSNISRLRKGSSVSNAITQFKQTIKNPNVNREVYLVLNFISKSGLDYKLNQLINGEIFQERNEIIQILWFISSLISSCQEIGVDVFICCKP